MAFVRAVVSIALCQVASAADGPSITGGAVPSAGQGTEAFTGPAGFTCSNGVRTSDWTSYIDADWIDTSAATVEDCWTAVQAQFPDAHGLMFLKIPVCRALTNLPYLAPVTGELAAEYEDYQGDGGLCVKTAVPTTTQVVFVGAASRIHGGVMALGAAMALQAASYLL